ncbi:MAG: site-2 protease family protein [Eubacteriaceae bacterium]|nr:site-2 protease family protein [Eubacteriaceae bacterium]
MKSFLFRILSIAAVLLPAYAVLCADGFYEFTVFFSAMFVHEIFHLICGRFLGMPVKLSGVGLFGIKLQFTQTTTITDRLLVFSGGIAGNIFMASLWLVAAYHTGKDMSLFIAYNIILAVINLIPAFPLDGGRILQCALEYFFGKIRSVRIVSMLGTLIGAGMFVWGIILYLFYTDNIILPVMGIFLIYNSEREMRMCRMAYVKDILGTISAEGLTG